MAFPLAVIPVAGATFLGIQWFKPKPPAPSVSAEASSAIKWIVIAIIVVMGLKYAGKFMEVS